MNRSCRVIANIVDWSMLLNSHYWILLSVIINSQLPFTCWKLCLVWTDFTHCSDVSIVDFKQENASWNQFEMDSTEISLESIAILSEHLKEKCSWENLIVYLAYWMFYFNWFYHFSHCIFAHVYTLSQQSPSTVSFPQKFQVYQVTKVASIKFLDLEKHRILFDSSFSK